MDLPASTSRHDPSRFTVLVDGLTIIVNRLCNTFDESFFEKCLYRSVCQHHLPNGEKRFKQLVRSHPKLVSNLYQTFSTNGAIGKQLMDDDITKLLNESYLASALDRLDAREHDVINRRHRYRTENPNIFAAARVWRPLPFVTKMVRVYKAAELLRHYEPLKLIQDNVTSDLVDNRSKLKSGRMSIIKKRSQLNELMKQHLEGVSDATCSETVDNFISCV